MYITREAVPCCHRPYTQTSRSFCHNRSPRIIIVTYPSCTVYSTDPQRSRTPTAELHHSAILMPRHEKGNPRYETPDLRRPSIDYRSITNRLKCIILSTHYHCHCIIYAPGKYRRHRNANILKLGVRIIRLWSKPFGVRILSARCMI